MVALGWVAGCGGGGAYDAYTVETHEYGSAQSQLQLLGVEQLVDGKRERMSLSEPLYSGDKTALLLSVPEPLFVYVVNIAPDGTQNVIWPSGSPRKVSGLLRIPEDGGWFTLTGEAGQEVIGILGTRDRQGLAGGDRDRVIAAVQKASESQLTRVQSALPPGLVEGGYATMGVRGHGLALQGATVRVTSYDPVVMLLDLDHRSR